MRSAVLAAMIIAGLSSTSHGQERLATDYDRGGKPGFLHGQGGRSCGSFIHDEQPFQLNNGIHAQDMAWVLGFLHGIDAWNPYDTRFYDYAGLNVWMTEYCKAHPIDLIANASNQFYAYIGGRLPLHTTPTNWQHYPGYTGRN